MKNNSNLYFGKTPLNSIKKTISLETIIHEKDKYFKISNYNKMKPFFMTIVSDVDFWMFVSSTGGLTCGRKNAESALFPYYTDDKIHDSNETTGPHTLFIVSKEDREFLWEPFSNHNSNVYNINRNLYKNVMGNKIMFEEVNHDLNLSYTYTWETSNKYGFVKSSSISNHGNCATRVKVLDGIRNILPYGVTSGQQTSFSTLIDGYKRNELHEDSLALYTLSSIITDKAEPSESLKTTTVWSHGFNSSKYLLSEQQVESFCQNHDIQQETDVKGRRGAYYVYDIVTLHHNDTKKWSIIASLNQSSSDVVRLINELKDKSVLVKRMQEDIQEGDNRLQKLVFEADGFQCTSREKEMYRHFSNTLFNIMRGGIYSDGYNIDVNDYREFISKWNSNIYKQNKDFIDNLPQELDYNTLHCMVDELNDSDMKRFTYEYLPLTYSRRHGDPSRPWNVFSIELSKEDGSKDLKFEGNWRDIFQNWEALSFSYPGYLEGIILKFLNASTADGYNPYRITKAGIDWEVLDPEDQWSNIGYWGDHQVIYLLRLMEMSTKFDADKISNLLDKDIFTYANVPYRIKDFEDLVKNPRNSIEFDMKTEDIVESRVKSIGSDGRLVFKDDKIYKANMIEKLLVMALTKLSNYVPEGGIWMNTQRPEWNDGNNALVGYGLSMVTLYYLHRFLVYLKQLLIGTNVNSFKISNEVYELFNSVHKILSSNKQLLGKTITDNARYSFVKEIGEMGQKYRNKIYKDGFSGDKNEVSKASIISFMDVALAHLKDSIHKNKRDDSLYHAYNLIKFKDNGCSVSYLYEMLEGQVSVLSSKALIPQDAMEVLGALRESKLYREDQNSYMLYPNRELPRFLEKNILNEEDVMSSRILKNELDMGLTRFVEKDVNGNYHFNGKYRNAEDICSAIRAVIDYSEEDIHYVSDVFTNLFNHHAFTGRSGTFFKYEGLGCIYWHMVSKLLLAAQETFCDAYNELGSCDITKKIKKYVYDIKEGIGLNKEPENYGAYPTDAYSHTPGFAGVQQPGMTGQVKEDILSRFGALGVDIDNGEIVFNPILLDEDEFLKDEVIWQLPIETSNKSILLEKESLGFTFCTTPIIYHLSKEMKLVVKYNSGEEIIINSDNRLSKQISKSIFNREGKVNRVDVYLYRE